jgi:hypothetical protein
MLPAIVDLDQLSHGDVSPAVPGDNPANGLG